VGAMIYMDSGVEMATNIVGRIQRAITGEKLFFVIYTNTGKRDSQVCFGGTHPGKILAVDLASIGGSLTFQKRA